MDFCIVLCLHVVNQPSAIQVLAPSIHRSTPSSASFYMINFHFCSSSSCRQMLTKTELVVALANEGVLRKDQGHNQTVQTQGLGENQNQNHTNEQLLLLTNRADAGIADNTNGHTSRKTRQTTAKTGRQMSKASVQRILTQTVLRTNDRALNDPRRLIDSEPLRSGGVPKASFGRNTPAST